MKYASICLLAYKRSQSLRECIVSLHQNTNYPFELIVNLDADNDTENRNWLFSQLNEGKISKLILVNGKNRGVGRSLANCIGMAEGDYIVKCDTDITFKPNWLTNCINILENNEDVRAVSSFDYRNYDPNDTRFNIIEERNDCNIVDDFVSSVYVFRKEDLVLNGWQEDDGFHQTLKTKGVLAITKEDLTSNGGFGVLKSTYVSGTEDNPRKTETFNKPLIYGHKE